MLTSSEPGLVVLRDGSPLAERTLPDAARVVAAKKGTLLLLLLRVISTGCEWDPKAQALFVTAAEVIGGTRKTLNDYLPGSESVWQSERQRCSAFPLCHGDIGMHLVWRKGAASCLSPRVSASWPPCPRNAYFHCLLLLTKGWVGYAVVSPPPLHESTSRNGSHTGGHRECLSL